MTIYQVRLEQIDVRAKKQPEYKELHSKFYKDKFYAERAKEDLEDFFQSAGCFYRIRIVELNG